MSWHPGVIEHRVIKHLRGVVTADDLVDRKCHWLRPNELWVTDITQHRTREGWVYCAAGLDAFSGGRTPGRYRPVPDG